MRIFHAATLAVAALWLGACSAPSSQAPGPTNPLSGNNQPGGQPPPATFRPQFDPLHGLLPYPSDLYLNGSTDGTVNLPALQIWPNAPSVNALDGFSTNGRITVTFSAPIDPASITPASVIMIETRVRTIATATTVARVPVGFRRVLTPGVDYTASVSTAADAFGQVLEIKPLKPLNPSTGGAVVGAPPGFIDEAGGFGYLVILTTGIKSAPAAGGANAAPDAAFAALETVIGTPPNPANCAAIADPTTNGLCQQIAPQLALAAGVTGILPPSIALTFSFTTQATRDTLVQMATAIQQANPLALAQAAQLGVFAAPGPGGILTTHDINPLLPGLANVYVGTITLPYYLPTPADATVANPAPPLNGQWLSATPVSLLPGVDCSVAPAPAACTSFVTRYNPIPAKTHDVTIPVLVTLPKFVLVGGAPVPAVKPNGGWPVVIFIHGITRSRADMLAIADAYASVGIAVIAIDLPLHGIRPTDAAAALRLPGVTERTFDVNYVNNTTLQPPAEPGNDPANIDPSGANFIQIASPITSRDNLREGIIDELTLAAVLPFTVALNPPAAPGGPPVPIGAPVIDGTKIQVAGQSLGSIAGITIASLPSSIKGFALSVPGGGIAQLLLDSATFGPPIGGAVAAQLGPDTLLFRAFFRDAQAAADAGDPINHITAAVANKSLLIHKVVNDQVIPNSATDRLFLTAGAGLTQMSKAAIGFCPVTPPPPAGFGTSTCPGNSYVTFTVGSHGSLLDPTASLAVTSEMQREFVGFAFSNGAAFPVFDTTNIQ